MYLLNAVTHKLQFFGGKRPLYAILSHVWEDEEVLFKDIQGPGASSMKGYAKIVACCAHAVRDGYHWVWIDTCCIDKTSSAELSEAINSMYRWYAESDVCYAYLFDVQSTNPDIMERPDDLIYRSNWEELFAREGKEWYQELSQERQEVLDSSLDAHTPFHKEFHNSKWFTRGWTLQELIAPQRVEFFNRTWAMLGTKATLQKRVAKITGIGVESLLGYQPVSRLWAGQVFSWAANRQTTRVEDTAYCLLGLLDLNMPLLYGEGPKAFLRLQEEILRRNEDYTLLLWGNSYLDDEGSEIGEPVGLLRAFGHAPNHYI
ncbi:HET-domain-containing protein [Xylariaceae sp. FL1651]|nr:HET-domain-containing protein [Xylariaceae sp. FL1651]